MRFTIRHVGQYLRGDLHDRVTGEETDEFLQAVAADALESGQDRILLSVHTSHAIFRVDKFRLAYHMEVVRSRPAHRIALAADDWEVQLSQQYIATLARQNRLNVQAFREEPPAIAWLEG
jgi:hypothetical protein